MFVKKSEHTSWDAAVLTHTFSLVFPSFSFQKANTIWNLFIPNTTEIKKRTKYGNYTCHLFGYKLELQLYSSE